MAFTDSNLLTWADVESSSATYANLRKLEDYFRSEASGGAAYTGIAVSALTAASGIWGLIIPSIFSLIFKNDGTAEAAERICDMIHNTGQNANNLKLQLDITFDIHMVIKKVEIVGIDHPVLH
ncbi:hypothetical protein [Fusibacter sp. 3D3]|uniref:hypothetical protein n=1 Tax=Fusibacter sp. 3D3 TaxID=1048380 RepID=UPI000852F399|nr:hypothetical protein [Fusibacter sp. 3D3]GAU76321.1 hypothetical protein F3D3_0918 [Fusibacter sp. 3D3]